jgi:hypothetical protein
MVEKGRVLTGTSTGRAKNKLEPAIYRPLFSTLDRASTRFMHDSAFNLSRLVNHMAVDPGQSPLNRLVGRSVFAGVVFNEPMRKMQGSHQRKTFAEDGTRIIAKTRQGVPA